MRLSDTWTRAPVELPAPPGPIRMYFCGPTVYARAHIGNARPFVLGMWLRAWLRASGYRATLVHNITDVNDKIYEAAPGASAELAERATGWYLEDTGALGLGMPDHLPRVSEHMPAIVSLIEQLVERGFAYPVDGDVYFRVARFPAYGRLSGQRPDQVEAQEPNPRKEDARDFALWKASKPGEDSRWPSPWGEGRPGWHIECTAMAEELLGPTFEIHGGGLDLVFPHHENELAQSRALGHGFARIWMHNGLLELGGGKMSKSAPSRLATLHEVLEEWGRETVLLFFLGGHWSKPIDFSEETMAQASSRLETLKNAFAARAPASPDEGWWQELAQALDDDFDTPRALEVMHGMASAGQLDLLERAMRLFGLDAVQRSEELLEGGEGEEGPLERHRVQYLGARPEQRVFDLLRERRNARARREWAAADAARSRIEELGYSVRDLADGCLLLRAGRAPHPGDGGGPPS